MNARRILSLIGRRDLKEWVYLIIFSISIGLMYGFALIGLARSGDRS